MKTIFCFFKKEKKIKGGTRVLEKRLSLNALS